MPKALEQEGQATQLLFWSLRTVVVSMYQSRGTKNIGSLLAAHRMCSSCSASPQECGGMILQTWTGQCFELIVNFVPQTLNSIEYRNSGVLYLVDNPLR